MATSRLITTWSEGPSEYIYVFFFLTIIGAINGCRQSVQCQYLHRLKIKVAQMEEWTQILLYFGKDLVRLLEEAGNQETCQQGLLASTAKSRLSIS